MEEKLPQKALGHVMEALESMGLSVTYAYDDLVFASHSAILFQFTDDNNILNYYLEKDFTEEEKKNLEIQLAQAFKKQGFQLEYKGRFLVSQNEGEELKIQMFPS